MFGTSLRILVVTAAVLLALFAPAPASAGTDRYTTITSLPYTISSPGGYRLTGNITYSTPYTNAITINCDNVVLDLDGFTIVYGISPLISPASPAIRATGRSNITIRNGKLRGFPRAIWLTGDGSLASLVVEDITATETYAWPAIFLETTTGAIVRRCQIANTTYTQGSTTSPITGIRMSGKSPVVTDNVVTLMKAASNTNVGIDVGGCSFAVVERNTIWNEVQSPYDGSIGIVAGGTGNIVVDNRIANTYIGVQYSNASGVYRDNIAVSCFYGYYYGTDAGNNH